jgi:threonine/homoserine/homoserine lactone efflux protein
MDAIIQFPVFVLAVLLLNATPGPDTAYIVGRSVTQGRGAGLWAALGISAGCCVHVIATAVGLSAIMAASPLIFGLIKWVGAIYLAWLGLLLLRAALRPAAPATRSVPLVASRGPKAIVLQGFLTNVLNPKVILFFLSFFPQFVDPAATSLAKTEAFLWLGLVFVLMSTVWNSGTAWLSGTLSQGLRQRPSVRRWLEGTVGLMFLVLGVRLALMRA